MAEKILVLGGFGDAPELPNSGGGGGGGGGGGEAVLINKSISANGTYYAANDDADGYKKVTVNVSPKLQSKTAEITSNGQTTVTPDAGKDGLSSVLIDVDVSPVLQSKSVTINANGTTTVSPDAGKDGLSSVSITAAVPNTYAAGDEGKVVSSGALVAQTSATYNTNNTYDTTLINSVTVNVSGGGPDPNHIDTGDTAHIFNGMTDWASSRPTWVLSGSNPSNRRTVFMASGAQEVKDSSGNGVGWYLIPIPSGATSVSVTVDKTLQFAVREFVESGGAITSSIATTGWTDITAGTGSAVSLTSGTNYMGVNFRVNSSGTSFAPATTQPYRVQLDFS